MKCFRNKSSVTVNPNMNESGLHYNVSNLQGQGSRSCQEDSFTVVNALDEEKYTKFGLMFTVCDGMGGMKNGKLASDTAVSALRDSFFDMDLRENIPEKLKEALICASKKIEDKLDGDGGSTAIICVIIHEMLYFASVGDSFLYLYRNGELCRINSEHTLCMDLYLENIRNNCTEVESCRNDSEASALTSYLGLPELPRIDYNLRPLRLRKGDVILSCSDGIGGVLDENEISDALSWIDTVDMCDEIEKYINKHAKPNQDNFTCVIVRCI